VLGINFPSSSQANLRPSSTTPPLVGCGLDFLEPESLGLNHANEDGEEYYDYTGYMGSPNGRKNYPAKCYNAHNFWQLGWFHDRAVAVEQSSEINNYGAPQLYKVAAFVDYDMLGSDDGNDGTVILINVEDYYMLYNRKAKFNYETGEMGDKLAIVKENWASTTLVAGLGAGDRYERLQKKTAAGGNRSTLVIQFCCAIESDDASPDAIIVSVGFDKSLCDDNEQLTDGSRTPSWPYDDEKAINEEGDGEPYPEVDPPGIDAIAPFVAGNDDAKDGSGGSSTGRTNTGITTGPLGKVYHLSHEDIAGLVVGLFLLMILMVIGFVLCYGRYYPELRRSRERRKFVEQLQAEMQMETEADDTASTKLAWSLDDSIIAGAHKNDVKADDKYSETVSSSSSPSGDVSGRGPKQPPPYHWWTNSATILTALGSHQHPQVKEEQGSEQLDPSP